MIRTKSKIVNRDQIVAHNETNANTRICNFYSFTAKDNDDLRFKDRISLSAMPYSSFRLGQVTYTEKFICKFGSQFYHQTINYITPYQPFNGI